MAHPGATHTVDITSTFERKVEALRAHRSQTSHLQDLNGMVRSWARRTAQNAGLPDGALAELFRVSTQG